MVLASTDQLASLDLAGNSVLAEGALALACGIQKATEAAAIDHRRDAPGTTKSDVVHKDKELQPRKSKRSQATSLRVLDLQGNMIGHAGWLVPRSVYLVSEHFVWCPAVYLFHVDTSYCFSGVQELRHWPRYCSTPEVPGCAD